MLAYKKLWIFLLLIFTAFFSTITGSGGAINADGKKVVLSVWSYRDDIKKFADRFMEQSPANIEVEVTFIPFEEYTYRLKAALADGRDVPDLFLGDFIFIKDIVEGGFWEDLSAEPFKADVKDMVPYVAQAGTDSQGKLRALSWEACIGGFFYRRSVAKKYLGTDDPQKVGELLSTPERFLETARILKEKSEGRVKIITGLMDYRHYPLAARIKPFIDKNKRFEPEKTILDFFGMAKIMKDEGLILNVQQWGTEWWENMNNPEPAVFGYILPTWGLQYVIKRNAGSTAGDWGLCKGPAAYFWGGSWLGISSGSRNKKAAWEFLKFVTLNQDTLEWRARESGDFVSSKTVINKIKNDFSDDFLAGQNHFKFFAEEALKINVAVMSKYDNEIGNYIMQAIDNFVEGNSSKEQALTELKNNVKDYVNAYEDWEKSDNHSNEGALGDEPLKRIVLSVWALNDDLKKIADRFEEQNPDIKIEITVIGNRDEYSSEINHLLESLNPTPDVFIGDDIQVNKFIDKGYWQDLSRPPYNADVSDMFPFTVQAAKDSEGRLRALCWQVWIGGFFYRRSLAKEYLGTDDPEKIGAMLSSEEKFIATGLKLRDKSGGKVKLLAGWQDYMRYVLALRKKSFVTKDNHFVLDEAVKRLFAVAQVLKKEGLTADYSMWSPEWFGGMRGGDSSIFGYSFGQWGIFILKNEASASSGDWGVCKGPSSYFWGGLWAGINANSQNKETAWKFLQFIALNRDTLEWWARDTGQFVNSKTVVNKLKKEIADEFLGGQKYFEYLADEALKIDGSLLSTYDYNIEDKLRIAITDYLEQGTPLKQAVEKFKQDVKNAFPELIVE